jgi:hypothetical protein
VSLINLEHLAELKIRRDERDRTNLRIEFLERVLGLKPNEFPRREEVLKLLGRADDGEG